MSTSEYPTWAEELPFISSKQNRVFKDAVAASKRRGRWSDALMLEEFV